MVRVHNTKIAIFGNAGSGKTTLAFQLKDALQLPLYHLDQYYWLPNWQRGEFEKFQEVHAELCAKDAWIIEGSYHKLLTQRIMHADVIIFLDMPRYLCLWRVFKRSLVHWGTVIPGNPAQCKQFLFTFKFLEFIQWVWHFNKRSRPMIYTILDEFKGEKHIYAFKSQQEVNAFLKKLQEHV